MCILVFVMLIRLDNFETKLKINFPWITYLSSSSVLLKMRLCLNALQCHISINIIHHVHLKENNKLLF